MTDKPNILFLFSDQHNAGCLSCAGHNDVKTPNLDKLAATGTRFENAYCQNPVCTPSRMSFLSSIYPSTHGYYGLYGPEPVQPMLSMFKYFKETGYRTGALGKLHTPRYWIERDCQFVYDEFIEHPKYLEGVGLYEQNDNRAFNGNRDGKTSNIPLEHSCEVVLAKQAVRFIHNQGEPADRGDDSTPWMAWISFARPHQPCTPSEPFASMYNPDEIFLPPTADTDNELFLTKRKNKGEEEIRNYLAKYLGLVSQVDYGIGLIMDELEKSGQLENTIIVYSSDHGDFAGEHSGFEKYGGISTRAITRIPMIVKTPATRGMVTDGIVESVDLFPTLCQLAGLDIPDTVQGISMVPVLRNPETSIRDSALTENAYRKAIATKKWRYIANIDREDDELYDQENDPWELNNLIHSPEHKDIIFQMSRFLLDRLEKARKPVNTLNGFWHKHKYDRNGLIDLTSCGHITPYW